LELENNENDLLKHTKKQLFNQNDQHLRDLDRDLEAMIKDKNDKKTKKDKLDP